jgi:hypothetical protein
MVVNIWVIGLLLWIAPAIILAGTLLWVRLRTKGPTSLEDSGRAADAEVRGQSTHAPIAAE